MGGFNIAFKFNSRRFGKSTFATLKFNGLCGTFIIPCFQLWGIQASFYCIKIFCVLSGARHFNSSYY